jgi:heme-degrading monooxygenase HmoA
MLIRVVRMTFNPDRLADFRTLFARVSPLIKSFPGCDHLELWRDAKYPNILTTYSHWTSEEALSGYRRSSLFEETWDETRVLFAAPASAYSFFPDSDTES